MRALPHLTAKVFADKRRRRIGILGGSFNPAHAGHAHIADTALKQLGLDEVWWMISPQNPLKSSADMAPFAARFSSAMAAASLSSYAKFMRISKLEDASGLTQTALTLHHITSRCPNARFVWVMGADNLASFHHWHRPDLIAGKMAIAVINRPGARAPGLGGRGARIAGRRLHPRRLAAAQFPPRHWCFINAKLNYHSASRIRAGKSA